MPGGRLLRGIYVPLITPFQADGSVALDALEGLARDSIGAGAAGLVALGTTGEAPVLEAHEQQAVITTCSKVCAELGAQLIVGAGTNSTAKTVAAVDSLRGLPALAATLIVVPYYVRPSEPGIVAHFEAVAAASPAPVIVYNIPARTGRSLGAAALAHLARTPNVAGMKQAVNALDADTLEVLAGAPAEFAVLSGDDAFILPTVLMGGSGAIAATAHLCTDRFVAMVECGLAGKVEEGRAHAEALLAVVQACFAEPNPSVFKSVLHAQGRIPTPDVRLPLVNASPESAARAIAAVESAS